MKKTLRFHPLYFLFWLLFFAVSRIIFLLYHYNRTQHLSSSDIALTFVYGFQLDMSFTAYLCLLPFLAVVVSSLWLRFNAAYFIRAYTYAFLVLISIMLAADLELYSFWGFRLDATPLQYFDTPAEMAASAAAAAILLLLFIAAEHSVVFIFLYNYLFRHKHVINRKRNWVVTAFTFFFLIVLILPMRGGWQQIPINQSVAYFSEEPFANHASLNMPWNLMHSLLRYNKQNKNPYQYMSLQEAEEKVRALYAAPSDSTVEMVKGTNPNVLFIILESYTAKFVGSLGGEIGVTPNLDSIAATGINFINMYASGDRSEKGMVALLSGYPVQTITSIIKTPHKTQKLPHLSKVFEEQNYSTSYYYGGELEFANIKSYLLNGGYDRLIDKDDFPASSYNSKWGAHDHVVFDRVLQDLKSEKKPFFSTVYTLSSHEPFEIPITPKFPGDDTDALFRNSVYYTDWALGRFLNAAKQQPWWENTLVVIVADHGHSAPGSDPNHVPSKFRIPFVMTGGALAANGLTVDVLGSQTDIATTLLSQLNFPNEEFKWGRDLLAHSSNPFAFYVFNDGFGFITPAGKLTFDNVAKKPITKDEGVSQEQIEIGKAYMQFSFEDFLKK